MTENAREPTPVELQVGAVLATLRDGETRDADFTVGALIAALGTRSHVLVILVFSALNMIPGPPGYGGTIAIAIIAFAVAMALGRPLVVHPWLARQRLPLGVMVRMASQLARVARLIGRFSRTRMAILTAPALLPVLAGFIIVVSLPMMLPIPLINAVPNVGISVLCLSWLNRDGVGVIAGVLIALAGLGLAGLAIWGAVTLAGVALGQMG